MRRSTIAPAGCKGKAKGRNPYTGVRSFRCTARAVGGEAFQQGVHLALGDAVFHGKRGHGVGHLLAPPAHGRIFDVKVDVFAVVRLYAGGNELGDEFAVELQYFEKGHKKKAGASCFLPLRAKIA